MLSSPHCIVMIAIGIPVVEGSSPLHLLSSLMSLVKLPCSSPDEETLLSYRSYSNVSRFLWLISIAGIGVGLRFQTQWLHSIIQNVFHCMEICP